MNNKKLAYLLWILFWFYLPASVFILLAMTPQKSLVAVSLGGWMLDGAFLFVAIKTLRRKKNSTILLGAILNGIAFIAITLLLAFFVFA